MRARTLSRAFERSGVGVHLGEEGLIRVEPNPWNTGLVAVIGGEEVRVGIDASRTQPGATVLVGPGGELHTPEHLLAALVGCGITDARIVAEGPEVPVLDGSAAPWCAALVEAGIEDGPEIEPFAVAEPVRVEANGGVAEAWPDEVGVVEVVVDFGEEGPRGAASVELDGASFAWDVAWARTFAMAHEISLLQAAGRGLGANLDNTVIWGVGQALNDTRSPEEPVLHKLVDAVGDLALIGRPFVGRVRITRGSHALHHALVRALVGG